MAGSSRVCSWTSAPSNSPANSRAVSSAILPRSVWVRSRVNPAASAAPRICRSATRGVIRATSSSREASAAGEGSNTPTRRPSTWERKMVSGVRSSWATSAAKPCRSFSSPSAASARALTAWFTWPNSSPPLTSRRADRSPAAIACAAVDRSRTGRAARRAKKIPSSRDTRAAAAPAASTKAITSPRNATASGSAVACGTRTSAVPTTFPCTVIGIRCTGPRTTGPAEGPGDAATAATRTSAGRPALEPGALPVQPPFHEPLFEEPPPNEPPLFHEPQLSQDPQFPWPVPPWPPLPLPLRLPVVPCPE